MKKTLILFLVLGCWVIGHVENLFPGSYYKAYHHFLGKHLRYYPDFYIDQDVLKCWMHNPPHWAVDQITEDLSAFPKISPEMLENAYRDHYSLHNYLVKIQIIKGQVYVPETLRYDTAPYRTILEAFAYLARRKLIPDSEFIFCFQEVLTPQKSTPAPIFTFSKNRMIPIQKDLILVPDWMNMKSWPFLEKAFRTARPERPLMGRHQVLFWRGAQTDWTGQRAALVAQGHDSPLIDAQFAGEPGMAPFVPTIDHLDYAFQVNIDGACCAWERLVWQLNSGSVVFKGPSPHVQWFYKGIQPGVHYLDLPAGKEEIHAVIEGLCNDPQAAQKLADAALDFAENNLRIEHMYGYMALLVKQYTARLEKQPVRAPRMQPFVTGVRRWITPPA